jgi:hypothetical protein
MPSHGYLDDLGEQLDLAQRRQAAERQASSDGEANAGGERLRWSAQPQCQPGESATPSARPLRVQREAGDGQAAGECAAQEEQQATTWVIGLTESDTGSE